jgi:type II secretory pathway component PulF
MTERLYTSGEVTSLVRANLYGWGIVATLVCLGPSLSVFNHVPEFVAMFKGFGAELPRDTQLLLNWPWLLWVLPAAAILLFVYSIAMPAENSIGSHRRIVWGFAALCVLSLVVVALAVRALYAPIFALGAVV